MPVERAHVLRGAVLALLALAVWGPTWSFEEERIDVVVLRDTSPSVADAPDPLSGLEVPGHAVVRELEVGSDLGRALDDAAGLVPVGGAGQIVLVSDGRSTDPIVEPAFPVDTLPAATVEGPPTPDLRAAVAPGASLDLELSPGLDRASLAGAELEVEPEADTLRLEADLAPGLHDLELGWGEVERRARLHVREEPRVLVVVPDPLDAAPLEEALSLEHFVVEVMTPAQVRQQRPDPAMFDLVALADVPAYDHVGGEATLDPAFLHDLRREVSGGLGLVVFGGTQSYDLGGWGESELGPVLPVKTQQNDGRVGAPVSVVVVLDNSGSMGQAVMDDGTNKLDLAVEGTLATRELLRSFDRIGVMSFDDRPRWHLRPTHIDDRGNQVERIRSVGVGGGGIYVYTSLQLAYAELEEEEAPLRHVILFSDAGDSEEQTQGTIFGWGPGHSSYDLAYTEWTRGVTTSVIGIGTEHDQDAEFLRILAERGGGRFYLTSDATELRALFMKETRRLVGSAVREKAYRPRTVLEHPTVEGLDFREAPLSSGYVKLKPRPSSQVVAEGPDGDPWLITWRYGLGHVVAVASDAGTSWSEAFSGWEGWPQLQAQIARHAMRDDTSGTTALVTEDLGAELGLSLVRRDHDGQARDDAQVALLLDGEALDLELVEPGLYEARAPWPEDLGRLQLVVDGEVLLDRGVARPTPLEHGPARPELLQQVSANTGGTHAAAWAGPREGRPFERSLPLWPLLAGLALVLLPVDAWMRRGVR